MKSIIFLAQSDTTAGFLSLNEDLINQAKGRKKQRALLTFSSLAKLKEYVRIPILHHNLIRKAKRCSFVLYGKNALGLPSLGVRVVGGCHRDFVDFAPFFYSSSANAHKKGFSLDFAKSRAHCLILDKRGLFESKASSIFALHTKTIKKIRS